MVPLRSIQQHIAVLLVRIQGDGTSRGQSNFGRDMRGMLLWGAVLAVCGCALTLTNPVVYHAFQYPAPKQTATAPVRGTLMVYRFLLAPTVHSHFLVIAKGEGNQEAVSQHRWDRSPADMITDLIQRDLEASGLFEKAVGQFSMVPYRYTLEGKILDLGGLMTKEGPRAVLETEVSLLDFETPMGADKTVMKKRYKIVTPCASGEPDSIAAGLSQAAQELSLRLQNDIQASFKRSRPREEGPSSARQFSPRREFLEVVGMRYSWPGRRMG
ncbi:MAG: ABC-type transport auxiliary lipoprotein family protein [Thermodesulfobacteriota bacterium]